MVRLLLRAPDNDKQRLTELQLWAVSVGAAGWVMDVEPYSACRVAGIVQHLRLDPMHERIDALVTDGTGVITARWPIRRPAPELAAVPGRAVILEGVSVIDERADLILLDPRFELVAYPEVA